MTFFKRCALIGSLFLRLIRVFFQMLYGAWRISQLPQPIISIFGSARLKPTDPYAKQAYDLANKFVAHNISVLTGGGAGIMQAANCGALIKGEANRRSIGIGVRDLEEGKNKCVEEYFELDYFFARKWLLTRYSVGIIVFPGGFGTLDELAGVLTLIQMRRIDKIPVILIGVEYWQEFMHWLTNDPIKHAVIDKEDLSLFLLTDDLNKAFTILADTCQTKRSPNEYTKPE